MKCIVVMGVCGSGKSTVGEGVAAKLNAKFIDGDDLHPRANIIKMRSGQPLDDYDRAPWLERVRDVIFSLQNRSTDGVIVCSALKKKYRDIIRDGNSNIIFLHLQGSKELILQRMQKRAGHFMKTDMVDSQFEALELPDANEIDVVTVDIDCSIQELIDKSYDAIMKHV